MCQNDALILLIIVKLFDIFLQELNKKKKISMSEFSGSR